MGALFAKKLFGHRTSPDVVELALDLTADAITLHERASHGAWKKFASAQLDDSEFPIVIGLLRTEVETHAGGRRPVRLWLPGEQVLKLQAPIEGENPTARLRAAFDYIDRETVYRRQDVAVAVAPTNRPANRKAETTILITFAETWREAKDYATRWGFLPGDVSTRHHCGDFGADGPVFQLHSLPPPPLSPIRRNRLAIAGLALFAIITGAAVWSLQPWGTPSTLSDSAPDPAPNAAIEVAEAPAPPPPAPAPVAAAPLPAPEPAPEPVTVTALDPVTEPIPAPIPVSAPATQIEILPPKYLPVSPALASPGIPGGPPGIATASGTLSSQATPAALQAPTVIAAAPSPPPVLEPAPLPHDPVTAWTGPLPKLAPPGLPSPPAAQESPKGVDAPIQAASIPLLAENGLPLQPPPAAPAVEPEPPEPPELIVIAADTAEIVEATGAALPVPIPIPRSARAVPEEEILVSASGSPLAKILPPPRPAREGQPKPAEPDAIIAAVPPADDAAVTPDASATVTPEQAETLVSASGSLLAKILPPPRPARDGQPEAEPGATIAAVTPDNATATTPDRVPDPVPESTDIIPEIGTPVAPDEAEDIDPPSKFASLTAPLPRTRPVLPALPRILPSASTLPVLTGPTRRSIQAAATETGLPLEHTTLIGILNIDTERKALLRLPNGRYRAVIVGDVLDGWRVSMIGVDAMRITRSGKDVTLLLVNR